ncbi:TetR/AcrR family transcriptional regulator [Microbacterium sp. AGC85]
MATRRNVPNDPDRRTRILHAALDVIADVGVNKASHSRIAETAAVSPGSLTYYFSSIDDIYGCAFEMLAADMSKIYDARMARVTNAAEAAEAVADLICGDYADHRSMVLIFEMYAYARHSEKISALTGEWTQRSRQSLAPHFSGSAARAIDALVEGWPMHREFENRPIRKEDVLTAIHALAAAFPMTDQEKETQ